MATDPSLNFADGVRRIDFVLAWDDTDASSTSMDAVRKRRIFEENLVRDGLQLERETWPVGHLHFIKIHAPIVVLKRTAEVMKLKIPLRDASAADEEESGKWNRWTRPFQYDPHAFQAHPHRCADVYSTHKDQLFDEEQLHRSSTRSHVVDFLLKRTRFEVQDEHAFGMERLLNEGIYSAAYPLHDGDYHVPGNERHLLAKHWASFWNVFRFQPLDDIKQYFGVKVALYFAWLGFYTRMLCVATLVGLIVFIVGLVTYSWNIPVDEICSGTINETMCPTCEGACQFWNIEDACPYSRMVHFFDNSATVAFSIFICIWSHLHLVIWRRQSARLLHRWNVSDELHELPRPQYLAHLEHYAKQFKLSRKALPWAITLPPIIVSILTVVLLFSIALLGVVGVIIFRMFLIHRLGNAGLAVSISAAVIDAVDVFILNQMFQFLAFRLTGREKVRTQSNYEDSLTVKISILQFVNYYGSIFYVAFFKGRFVGYPADYNKLLGYRQEECLPGGCLVELCIQLAIIMIGNQLVVTLFQMIGPRVRKFCKRLRIRCGLYLLRLQSDRPWTRDYQLNEWNSEALFAEYLQMVLQYGFVTIFVAAFPLAPFLALVANILELRIDAQKFLQCHRRPVAQEVKGIGIWFQIMQFIGYFSIFTNAAIIAFSSDFIPKLFYRFNRSADYSLRGYVNYSLSYFNTSDYPQTFQNAPATCRYRDFRQPFWSPQKYELTPDFWNILVYRLLFVLIFICVVSFVLWLLECIPSTPQDLRDRISAEVDWTRQIQTKHLRTGHIGQPVNRTPVASNP